jgi:hypothetical protein
MLAELYAMQQACAWCLEAYKHMGSQLQMLLLLLSGLAGSP